MKHRKCDHRNLTQYEGLSTADLENMRTGMTARIRTLEEELQPLKEACSTIAYILFRRSYKETPVHVCKPFTPTRLRHEREVLRNGKRKDSDGKYKYSKDFILEFLSWPKDKQAKFLADRDSKEEA